MSTSIILNVQALGNTPWPTIDPFLFCVHHNDAYPRGNVHMGPDAALTGRNTGQDFAGKDGWSMYHGATVPGFPAHPHRGFETVTIVRKGLIDHSDSLGATARFGGGDVQWLTAGKGIVHCEMFPLVNIDAPNPTELFQIWLNLPAKNKMAEPHFTMLWNEDIPRRTVLDAAGRQTDIVCIAGTWGDTPSLPPPPASWASEPGSDLGICTLKMAPHAEWTLPPASHAGTRRQLYFFAGSGLRIEGTAIPAKSAIEVRADVPCTLINGETEYEILVLQGHPIAEPVAQYGPFVMNTAAEIQQAFADYRRTQFGGWPWGPSDPAHPRDQQRFARHANGRVQTPS
ncbi:MAG: pirin [Burkholderiales bacterium PBB3]|nr:MAG: pirin [Burkholderiales bacterium PBB3]